MDRLSPGEMEAETKVAATTASEVNIKSTTSAVITMTATSVSTSSCSLQTAPLCLSGTPRNKQAVQEVQQEIQQAISRPQTMAAQYLQQMYAAQQQHLMLQTAALQQQQHTPRLQSVAIVPKMTLPTPSLTAQLIGRNQVSSSAPTGGSVSQQAMLLGKGSSNCSQAQMYLRTQMLILTPAASVAGLQSDLPPVSSSSSLTHSPQSLVVPAHVSGPEAIAQDVLHKTSSQSKTLVPSLPKMSLCPQKACQQPDTSTESSTTGSFMVDVTRLSSTPELLTPATYSPVQSPALVKHQVHCTAHHRGAHHQLIIQRSRECEAHRQLHPIAIRIAAHDTPPSPLPLCSHPITTPTPVTIHSQHANGLPISSTSDPSKQSVPQRTVVVRSAPPPPTCPTSQPLSLVSAPLHLNSFFQPQPNIHPQGPLQPLALSRLPQAPPVSPQRLSLHSVQSLSLQSSQVLVSEGELPMPFQNLSPPQTVAVDLKVHLSTKIQAPSPCRTAGSCTEEKTEESLVSWRSPRQSRTPSPPAPSPTSEPDGRCKDTCTDGSGFVCVTSSCSEMRLPEESSHVTSSPTLSPLQPPAGIRSSSPLADQQACLSEAQVRRANGEPGPKAQDKRANGEPGPEHDLLDAEQTENFTDSEMDDAPTPDEPGKSVGDVLQCEFCGKKGYVHSFLRSKRFCSMTCVRRFNVSCTKRISMLKADRAGLWGRRPLGRRGRPPGRMNGGSREQFLRQVQTSQSSEQTQSGSLVMGKEGVEEPPSPMTTRLRHQAERGRERERLQEREKGQRTGEVMGRSDEQEGADCRPTQWSVGQVFSYINSLPGGRHISEEFRSQEIDGQALLLLTEDHLVSTMKFKLGPALKLCAHINSLKEA